MNKSWLRGCKDDSDIALMLIVGLYRQAMISNAVPCRKRVYGVKASKEDLTTFIDYNWNHWTRNYPSRISSTNGDFFLESIGIGSHHTYILKTFQNAKEGEPISISFDYKISDPSTELFLYQDDHLAYRKTLTTASDWKTEGTDFELRPLMSPTSMQLTISINSSKPIKIKNILVRKCR